MSMSPNDREWILLQLARFEDVYNSKQRWKLFEPSDNFYNILMEANDQTLQMAVDQIAHHLSIATIPDAKYEWGLKMNLGIAGDIKIGSDLNGVSFIRIPFFYIGKPYAIGSILAHELSHQLNAALGIWESNLEENERLTDITVIASGLGKLKLNGMSQKACDVPGMFFHLGYLNTEETLYAYELTNLHYELEDYETTTALLPDVVSQLRDFRNSID